MLAYDVRGRGSLLVLIQGVGVAAGVGSGWSTAGPPGQVITIDNRGIGAFDAPPGHYSARVMAQDVLAVLTTPASSEPAWLVPVLAA
jgi:hypothetical protein